MVVPGPQPLVSIVTPTLNMGRFLEETISSVLAQDYPRVEYLVLDGGSTDNTTEILRRQEGRLRWVVGADSGQADSVNRGFAMTSGSIFAFLNADDTYLPGAISAVVRAFGENPAAGVIYGNAWRVAEDGSRISPYPVEAFDAERLARRCFICQPAAFFRREAFAAAGMLNAKMRFAIDYDLWIRMARRFAMVRIEPFLATSRMHAGAKTMSQMEPALLETIEMLKRHYGYVPYNWIYGYAHHHRTGQPLAVELPRASLASAVFSMAWGAQYNWRHPLRFSKDVLATAREGIAWTGH
jgi:glycosyltransferase involved in cell wall biosynthesis